jgi:uncharacterized protein
MKVVIPGGSGQVGTLLARGFRRDGHEVVILSRGASGVHWDGRTEGPWFAEVDGADVVINLAGRSVNCRYNDANRRAITQSRVDSTRIVGHAIAAAESPPRLWLQASTATIYAHTHGPPNDEHNGRLGGDEPDVPETWRFSIDVARAWERAFEEVETARTRKVAMRSAMVMSPDRGGIFDELLRLVRRGLGGTPGDGRQFVSWIHHDDFYAALRFLIEHEELDGPVNLAAPEPLPMAEFMRALREAWGMRFGLPATTWMLEIGALIMRTETELVLKSRRVVPGRLREAGFEFAHPRWPEASRSLCEAYRRGNRPRG